MEVRLSKATAVPLSKVTDSRLSRVVTRRKASNMEVPLSKATDSRLKVILLKAQARASTAHPHQEVARRKVVPVATLASSLSTVPLPQVAVTRKLVS